MQLTEQQFYALYDLAVSEGEPLLLPGPIDSLPAGVPPEWIGILTARDCRAAAAQLWAPLAEYLPRVCRTLRERLAGVAYLSTEKVAASLLYFFRDGDDLVEYRGRAPLPAADLAALGLPAEIGALYCLHDGWTLYLAGDLGPLPADQWVALTDLGLEIDWRLPRGDLAAADIKVMYREGDDLLLAYDCARTPPLPLILRADGSVDCLLDPWDAMDREIGAFLAERTGVDQGGGPPAAPPRQRAKPSTVRLTTFSSRLRTHRSLAAHLGGGAIHQQTAHFLLDRAALTGDGAGRQGQVLQDQRRALEHWCAAAELGADVTPADLMGMFGLAQALGDAPAAEFVLTIPAAFWDDDSLAAAQTHVFVALGLGDGTLARTSLDELLGLTFDGEQAPTRDEASTARLLEALVQGQWEDYAARRRNLVSAAGGAGPDEGGSDLPWSIRISGFDALAARLDRAAPPG